MVNMKRYFFVLFLALLSNQAYGKPLKLLYWNIQNGMWADQQNNYDNFVKFVKDQAPDICVWCEAKSLYYDGTDKGFADDMERYLPSNWDELAERYGHSYVYLGGYRDNYPQVITSKYPIRNAKRIVGERPDSIVSHGAAWAQITIKGKTYNIVTLHTWPMPWAYGANGENRKESQANHGGDCQRRLELEYICQHSYLTRPNPDKELWMMMGDFNSRSIVDNYHYRLPENSPMFYVHNYIREHTTYRDVIAEKHPGDFQTTVLGDARIDFIYASPSMMDRIGKANVIREGFAANHRVDISNFCIPSDHLPILIEFKP